MTKSSLCNTLYVLLDNGHGYDTQGKCSPDKSIVEWAYTRELTSSIAERLRMTPTIKPVILVPETKDVPLKERAARANKYVDTYGAKNCLLVSVHLNAAGNGEWMNASGWEIYTTPGQTNSDLFATMMHDIAKDKLGINTRTDYSDGDPDKEAKFYIISATKCPAVLTENMFMDGKKDNAFLLSPEGFNAIVALHTAAIRRWHNIFVCGNNEA